MPGRLRWGAIAALVYLGVATVTFHGGSPAGRPLFDSLLPPEPYAWVNPPPGFNNTAAPAPGAGAIALTSRGSVAGTVATDDAQALVSFYGGSFKPMRGETTIRIAITPLDAASLAPAPDGKMFDSNAYRITAVYARSKAPARAAATMCPANQSPKVCPTILLRFAIAGKGIDQLGGGNGKTWVPVGNTLVAAGTLQLFADVPSVGTVVAIAPAVKPESGPGRSHATLIISIGLAVAAVVAAAGLRLRKRR